MNCMRKLPNLGARVVDGARSPRFTPLPAPHRSSSQHEPEDTDAPTADLHTARSKVKRHVKNLFPAMEPP